MIRIRIKRVYDPVESSDGLRVLVDKLWPRGMRKEDLHYDLWAKDLAPTPPLRQWFHEDPEGHWEEFRRRYRQELEVSGAVAEFIAKIHSEKTVTLLYASKNATENHALILQEFLQGRLGETGIG